MGNTDGMPMNFRQMHKFMVEVWQLYQEYAASDLTEGIIELFSDDVDQLRIKYQDHNFANAVLIALVSEIGLIAKGKGDGNDQMEEGTREP